MPVPAFIKPFKRFQNTESSSSLVQSAAASQDDPVTNKSASLPKYFSQKQVVVVSTLHMIILKAFEWGVPLEWQWFGL